MRAGTMIARLTSGWGGGLFVLVLGLGMGACQTSPELRAWEDEFTGTSGYYVFASRQSGGHDVRFAVVDQRPGELKIRVRSRGPIHGKMAYFLIDDQRYERPLYDQVRTGRATTGRARGGIGAGTGGGAYRFGVGMGVSYGPPRYESIYYTTISLDAAFVQRLIEAEQARFRVGDPPAPTFTLSEITRQRVAELIQERGQEAASESFNP